MDHGSGLPLGLSGSLVWPNIDNAIDILAWRPDGQRDWLARVEPLPMQGIAGPAPSALWMNPGLREWSFRESRPITDPDGLQDSATVRIGVESAAPSGFASDDFSGGTLAGIWTLEGPDTTATATLAQAGAEAYLALTVPDGNHNAWKTNKAVRVMQDAPDADFTVRAGFLALPSKNIQNQGILIEQDAQNWIRFDTYYKNGKSYIFAATTVNGVSSAKFNIVIPSNSAYHLQVERTGNQWSFAWSADGLAWNAAGSFSQALAVTSIGPFAGGTAAGFTALVDYFKNLADPILDEDGSILPVNTAPDAVDDTFAATDGNPIAIAVADLLANDTDPDGDPLAIAAFTQPTNGTLADNGNGTLTYTPATGFTGTDSFTYTITDPDGLQDSATVRIGVGDLIDVWYGDVQGFGAPGATQRWINILGNVDPTLVTALSYSLNGGAWKALSLGPDTRRLELAGDFNIDIGFAALNGSATDDVVTIRASLAGGGTVTRDVTIDYEAGNRWATDYAIDWSSVTSLQDVVQVVDGKWAIEGDGVRTVETGYDRILAMGDRHWDNYEVTLSLTVNEMHPGTVRDGAGLGFGMLWKGHTDNPVGGWQPKAGYQPIVSPFYSTKTGAFTLHDHAGWGAPNLGSAPFTFAEDTTYNVTVRIEQTNLFDRVYKFRIWKEGEAEPVGWLLEGTESMGAPVNGSFMLIAHHWDISFHDISVTGIEGRDILMGGAGADILIGVDTAAALPGAGEIDVFRGRGRADLFILGDTDGRYYDDGTADAGMADYAYIWDFVSGTDQIQLAGSAADYVLSEDHAALPTGTAIWYRGGGGTADELIAVLRDVYSLELNGPDFLWTGLA